ncbi:MAG: hypothetical protein QOG19_2857 [Mycobacterium sp.]|jgi:hypothetical protein|nr:hypothetical protein [Mycobacterium sp.]
MPDPERQRLGRLGGLTASSKTQDWNARMEPVRGCSPATEEWHAKRLGFTPDAAGKYTPAQSKQIATAKKLYYARLREASVAALKRQKVERLRKKAAAIVAEAARIEADSEAAAG